MSSSGIDAMLARLHWLSKWDRYHRSNMGGSKPNADRTFVEQVFAKRIAARRKSSNLLNNLRQSEMKKCAAPDTLKRPGDESQAMWGWWVWLERLEDELAEEMAFLDSAHEDYLWGHAEREKRLIALEAELFSRQDKSARALSRVIKWIHESYNLRKTTLEDTIERLSRASIPRELLTLVVEKTVRRQVAYLTVNKSTSLAAIASKVFGTMPELNVEADARDTLQRLAARAILEHSIIKLPARFMSKANLATPSTLQFREYFIRHLVLDLHTKPRKRRAELFRATEGITSLKPLFPNLTTCTVLLHLFHDGYSGLYPYRYQNICDAYKTIESEEAFVDFITAFIEHGPGKRKLIRFSHGEFHSRCRYIGPLGPVSDPDSASSEKVAAQIPTTAEDQQIAEPKHIFRMAYGGEPLGPLRQFEHWYGERYDVNFC